MLNAGSGTGKAIGYQANNKVNIDINKPLKGVQGDILKMPFKDEAFEEVRLIHVLEHVFRHQQVPMLSECYRVLKSSGVFYVEVPDFLENMVALVREYRSCPEFNNEPNWEMIRIATVGAFGKQRYPGDAHHWGYNEHYLREQLERIGDGWQSIERSRTMVSNHWQMENVILMKCIK